MGYLSESELLERFHLYIAAIEDQLRNQENSGDINYDIPLITIISRPEVLEFINTNKIHQHLTGYSLEEVREDSEAYTGNIVHADSMENVKRFLPDKCHSHWITLKYTPFGVLIRETITLNFTVSQLKGGNNPKTQPERK